MIQRPGTHQDIERAAAERAEPRGIGHTPPEVLERGTGAIGAAPRVTQHQHGGIHGAG
ncbi:hypothetical protein D3C78_1965940 [compost metagenome]